MICIAISEVKRVGKGGLTRKREKGESHRMLKTEEMETFKNPLSTALSPLYVG